MTRHDDIVTLFKDEAGKIVGILVMNGTTEFYRCAKATKEFIKEELLEINQVKEK